MKDSEKLSQVKVSKMLAIGINKRQSRSIDLCQKLNKISYGKTKKREKLIKKIFGTCGKHVRMKPGFYCDKGSNIHVGDNFFANYNLVVLDIGTVTIGNNVWIGPGVGIYAVAHPIDAAGRYNRLSHSLPVTIGNCVWIGGNATICMGVSIGDNAVIGAGSVVIDDIPANAVAVGNPAKVIRYIDNN